MYSKSDRARIRVKFRFHIPLAPYLSALPVRVVVVIIIYRCHINHPFESKCSAHFSLDAKSSRYSFHFQIIQLLLPSF
jgi:hypothetical protein